MAIIDENNALIDKFKLVHHSFLAPLALLCDDLRQKFRFFALQTFLFRMRSTDLDENKSLTHFKATKLSSNKKNKMWTPIFPYDKPLTNQYHIF